MCSSPQCLHLGNRVACYMRSAQIKFLIHSKYSSCVTTPVSQNIQTHPYKKPLFLVKNNLNLHVFPALDSTDSNQNQAYLKYQDL